MSKLSASAKGAVFIGLVAILYLFDGRELSMGSVSMPGEGFVPRVMGIFLLACCVALFSKEVFFRQLVGDAEKKEPEHGELDEENTKRPLYLMIALLVYAGVLPFLGFILSTLGLMLASFRIFEFRNWGWSFLMAAAATAVTYFVFEKWLQILFPPGLWG